MFSWYKYLIVNLFFPTSAFWSGNLFLIAPFPDRCLLVPNNFKQNSPNVIMFFMIGDPRFEPWNARYLRMAAYGLTGQLTHNNTMSHCNDVGKMVCGPHTSKSRPMYLYLYVISSLRHTKTSYSMFWSQRKGGLLKKRWFAVVWGGLQWFAVI